MKSTARFSKTGFLLAAGAFVATCLTGCGLGTSGSGNSVDVEAGPISGRVHGGPNPVVGGKVVLYATTATGYGVGSAALATTTTDANGNWNFGNTAATCPAGQYAYVVIYGGKTGSNATNPNSVLMTALGSCSTISTSTFVWTDELTTIAAGYALSNFIGITGNSVAGYVVGVGSSATNNAAAGCVANAYYSGCTTTTAAGMAHAFSMATRLVSTTSGQVNATLSNGAIVPTQLINTLGNALQACVNSNGGGTNGAGAPVTTTSASGTTTDGTACGNLSAYTSYTSDGTTTGTVIAAGNTLGFVQNLAKRPLGSTSTTFTNASTSATVCSGAAAACVYALAPAQGAYQTSMTAAPVDFSMTIYYPKGSFNSTANTTTCTGSTVPATLGLLYPYAIATDINDNIAIVNGDSSTVVCLNVITAGFDGTPIGATAFDNSGALPNWVSNDSFGHTIVPVHGGNTPTTNNGVRIYATGTDSAPALLQTYSSGTTLAANLPYWVTVDQNDTIWIGSQAGTNDFGWLTLTGANSHAAPVYTGGTTATAITGKAIQMNTDIYGDVFFAGSSGSGSSHPYVVPKQVPVQGSTAYSYSPTTDEAASSSTSNGAVQMADTSGNDWIIDETTLGSTPFVDVAFNSPYTTAAGAFSNWSGTSVTTTGSSTTVDVKITGGQIDGNNVIWWSDSNGSTSTTPISTAYLHGFDTTTRNFYPTVNGCLFYPAGTYTVTSSTIGASSTVFTVSNTAGPAVGSTVTLSGFPSTSAFYNGQSVAVTANSTGPTTFTVANTFGQAAGVDGDAGNATYAASTHCGTLAGDPNYPSNTPYAFYGTRGVTVDSSGNIWASNGTQGHVSETIGIAAPTWPTFIHNGSSNKP